MTEEREEGYYKARLRYDAIPVVAYFDGYQWWLHGDHDPHDENSDFLAIGDCIELDD